MLSNVRENFFAYFNALETYSEYIKHKKACCVTYYCHINYLQFQVLVTIFFSCSHEITEDSNANQTTDLEKENFNDKDNDEETMLVSILKRLSIRA